MNQIRWVVLTALASVCFGRTVLAQMPSIDLNHTDAQEQLNQGSPYIKVWRDKSRTDQAIDVFGVIDITAPPEIIWAIMLDCKQAKTIVPQMTSCEVLETSPDGSWDIRRQKIKVGAFLPKSVSIFRSDYIYGQSIQISLIGGNMKIQSGNWKLTSLNAEKTRVTYRASLKPKFPVPKFILKNGVRQDVPTILLNLKREAEKKAYTQKKP